MSPFLLTAIVVCVTLFCWALWELGTMPRKHGYRRCGIHGTVIAPGYVCVDCMAENIKEMHTMDRIEFNWPAR